MKNYVGSALQNCGPFLVCLIVTCALNFSLGAQAKDKERRDIRFYKANKILQTDRIRFTRKKANKLGCHNFVKKARVYKLVQFGYVACYIFSDKDCASDSVVAIAREKDEITSAVALEGYGWYPHSDNERGVKLKSWSCSNDALSPSTFEGIKIESRAQAKAKIKERERQMEQKQIEAAEQAQDEANHALEEANIKAAKDLENKTLENKTGE